MSRPGYRVFIDPGRRGKEPGNEIISRVQRATRDNDAASGKRREPSEAGREATQRILRVYFRQKVHPVAADVSQWPPQSLYEGGRGFGWLGRFGGEVELNALSVSGRSQEAAFRLKAYRVFLSGDFGLPENVRGRQRSVSAEQNFGSRGEPAEFKRVRGPHDERCLGQIHLPSNGLEPSVVAPGR